MRYTTIKKVEAKIGNKMRYGYMVEDLAGNEEFKLNYSTREERDEEVTSDSIRDVLVGDFYTIAKEIQGDYFVFENRLRVF